MRIVYEYETGLVNVDRMYDENGIVTMHIAECVLIHAPIKDDFWLCADVFGPEDLHVIQ